MISVPELHSHLNSAQISQDFWTQMTNKIGSAVMRYFLYCSIMIFYILSLPHKLLFLNCDKAVINHYTFIGNCNSSDYSVNFYFSLVMMTSYFPTWPYRQDLFT